MEETLSKKTGFDGRTGWLNGLWEHTGTGLLWIHLKVLCGTNLMISAIGHKRGLKGEDLNYLRADCIYALFGPWSLKRLRDHFWPDITIKRFREINHHWVRKKEIINPLATFEEEISPVNGYLLSWDQDGRFSLSEQHKLPTIRELSLLDRYE